jgi:tRNA (guanine37-N1)-methyltransferase
MNISVFSVFPQLYEPFVHTSLIKRAQDDRLVSLTIQSYVSLVEPKTRIDAPTYGPGAGMLIRPDVIQKAVEVHTAEYGTPYTIFFSPQGTKLTQRIVRTIYAGMHKKGNLLLLPARYEGMDARVEERYADMIISVGDLVLMGGDIPTMMLIESLLRLIPGVVGKSESVERDSFYGPFVDYPEYTAPVDWDGLKVPDIVRSGNHAAIEQWRLDKAVAKSVVHHFNWVRTSRLDTVDKKKVYEHIPPHYVALLHSNVYVRPHRKEGTTSVTSLDIHDIARSCRTYGIEKYFIVTPLSDQQRIVHTLIDFWMSETGAEHNNSRQQAIERVAVQETFDSIVVQITQKHGVAPLVIATSARALEGVAPLSYFDQDRVWSKKRPVLLIFGTGSGLTDTFLQKSCDYLLLPVQGFVSFNHLSVRSAAAIVLDRWLGVNQQQVSQ